MRFWKFFFTFNFIFPSLDFSRDNMEMMGWCLKNFSSDLMEKFLLTERMPLTLVIKSFICHAPSHGLSTHHIGVWLFITSRVVIKFIHTLCSQASHRDAPKKGCKIKSNKKFYLLRRQHLIVQCACVYYHIYSSD